MYTTRVRIVVVLLAASLTAAVYGQPVPSRAPASTHIYPAGGRRGASVAVRVGAECLPPGAEFIFVSEGVQAPARLEKRLPPLGEPSPRRAPTEIPISYPKEWESRVQIAGDAPLGIVDWRLSCAQGGTTCRPFVIGDLPEHLERESNSTADSAEPVKLPLTLNGQICGERDMDYYRFALARGETAVLDVYAARLGSRLDPIVEIRGPAGQLPRVSTRYLGNDPVLAFQAAETGDYIMRVANVSVHGSPAHVYRINLTTKPYVRLALPPGGSAGETVDVKLVALASGRQLQHRIRFPATPGPFSYYNEALAARVTLFADAGSSRLEKEPNDNDRAEIVSLGETVYGSFASPDDEDWFRIRAQQGERLQLACHAFPPGSAALPVVTLCSSDGQEMEVVRSVESDAGICRFEWTASATAEYLIRARDLRFGARGSDDFLYRLAVSRSSADFAISVESDVANVEQGKRVEVEVKVQRWGGFSGEIRLEVAGLPEHVQLGTSQIDAGKSAAKLTLQTSDGAVAQSSRLRIFGVAEIDGKTVRHAARSSPRGGDAHLVNVGHSGDSLFLSVMHKPIFRLYCSEAYLYAHRGSIFPYPMEVERLNGFDGDIQLQIGDRQNRDLDGIEMLPITVPASQTSLHMPIYLPESMHINVQSQSQLYTQGFARFRDKHGRPQSILVVAEKRNMLRTRPPVVTLTAVDSRVDVVPGQPARLRLRLKRTSNFPGPLRVDLWKSSRERMSVEPFVIRAGSSDAVVRVMPPADLAPGDEVRLTFRGQGDLSDGTVIVSEAHFMLKCAVSGG